MPELGLGRELHAGETPDQRAERNLTLQAHQRRAQAVVDATAEGDVLEVGDRVVTTCRGEGTVLSVKPCRGTFKDNILVNYDGWRRKDYPIASDLLPEDVDPDDYVDDVVFYPEKLGLLSLRMKKAEYEEKLREKEKENLEEQSEGSFVMATDGSMVPRDEVT